MNPTTYRFPDLRPSLRDLGIDAARVLRAANLPLSIVSENTISVTLEQMFAFWIGVEAVSDDPLIGVKIACSIPLEKAHPACIAAQHASTFRDALQRLSRYKALCCAEEMRLEEANGECRVSIRWIHAKDAIPARLIDAIFASNTEMGRRGANRRINPVRVELARPMEAVEQLESFFGCRIHFNAKRDYIVFASRDLDLPFVTYNQALLEMLSPSLDRELAKRKSASSLASQVKWVAQRLLGKHLPQIAEVAKELAMSPRTLQRRIAEEGASFRQLLADARRELAHDYLSEPKLSLAETACLLGFEDPNSFFRAFREWEGVTPGEWRDRNAPGQNG